MMNKEQVSLVIIETAPFLDALEVLENSTGWEFILDHDIVVGLELNESGTRLEIDSDVAHLHTDRKNKDCQILLSYNAIKLKTGGLNFSLAGQESKTVVLNFSLSLTNLNAQKLAEILANFLDIRLVWKELLESESDIESDTMPAHGIFV